MRWEAAVELALTHSRLYGIRYRVYAVRWAYGARRWRWFVCPVEGR